MGFGELQFTPCAFSRLEAVPPEEVVTNVLPLERRRAAGSFASGGCIHVSLNTYRSVPLNEFVLILSKSIIHDK